MTRHRHVPILPLAALGLLACSQTPGSDLGNQHDADISQHTDAAADASQFLQQDGGPAPELLVTITQPQSGGPFELGSSLTFAAAATCIDCQGNSWSATWSSSRDGPLVGGTVTPNGQSASFELISDALSLGTHAITLAVDGPDAQQQSHQINLGICDWGVPDTFDTDVTGAGWQTYGNAYWDAGGWLEMTDNLQNRKGGFIGFTGTTGFYTNYHRFDNLQILADCLVP